MNLVKVQSAKMMWANINHITLLLIAPDPQSSYFKQRFNVVAHFLGKEDSKILISGLRHVEAEEYIKKLENKRQDNDQDNDQDDIGKKLDELIDIIKYMPVISGEYNNAEKSFTESAHSLLKN